jgi:hypothetical protein
MDITMDTRMLPRANHMTIGGPTEMNYSRGVHDGSHAGYDAGYRAGREGHHHHNRDYYPG